MRSISIVILLYLYSNSVLHMVSAQLQNVNCQGQRQSCRVFEATVRGSSKDGTASAITDTRLTRLRWLDPGNCYVLVRIPMTYQKALQVCRTANGTLAWANDHKQITDLTQHALIQQVLHHKNILFDGLTVTFPNPSQESSTDSASSTSATNTTQTEQSTLTTSASEEPIEGVWIGMSPNDKNSLVWQCSEPGHEGDPVTDPYNKYCMEKGHKLGEAAALCHGVSTENFKNKSCICWNNITEELPFYCQTSSVCAVEVAKPCDAFKDDLKSGNMRIQTFSIPNIEKHGLVASSCYVLVDNKTDWSNANTMCSNAGGRLAWINHGNNYSLGANTLLNFAKQHLAIDANGSTAWIGLQRWQLNQGTTNENSSWWVERWFCPSGRGQSHQFLELNIYLDSVRNGTPPWTPVNIDPNETDVSFGHLQSPLYSQAEPIIGFDTLIEKLLPYYCEITSTYVPSSFLTTVATRADSTEVESSRASIREATLSESQTPENNTESTRTSEYETESEEFFSPLNLAMASGSMCLIILITAFIAFLVMRDDSMKTETASTHDSVTAADDMCHEIEFVQLPESSYLGQNTIPEGNSVSASQADKSNSGTNPSSSTGTNQSSTSGHSQTDTSGTSQSNSSEINESDTSGRIQSETSGTTKSNSSGSSDED